MKVEMMIYVYIAICVSMIAYNIVYVFILSHRDKSVAAFSEKLKGTITEQLEALRRGETVSEKHINYLYKKLDKATGVTAFDVALEDLSEAEPDWVKKYLLAAFPAFERLTQRYIHKDTLKIAYFPYILYKYDIPKYHRSEELTDALLDLLRSVNVYCRENALKALYSMQDPDIVVQALKIIDKNLSFHHPKLLCDGLMCYKGDTALLKEKLFASLDAFTVQLRVSILNYFRFAGVRCDEEMLAIMQDEKEDSELRFSAIRYFEKFAIEAARPILYDLAENTKGRTWEFQVIATSALKAYPGDVTFRILVKNLSSSNWHVRQNSAISCEKLGYTYQDLISVFDGNDRYAREMMRYRLDRRKAEEEEEAAGV